MSNTPRITPGLMAQADQVIADDDQLITQLLQGMHSAGHTDRTKKIAWLNAGIIVTLGHDAISTIRLLAVALIRLEEAEAKLGLLDGHGGGDPR